MLSKRVVSVICVFQEGQRKSKHTQIQRSGRWVKNQHLGNKDKKLVGNPKDAIIGKSSNKNRKKSR